VKSISRAGRAMVTVFVNLTPAPAFVPSGSVSISEGGAILGTEVLAGGTASFSLNPFAVGDHMLVVNYGGDADFEATLDDHAPGIFNRSSWVKWNERYGRTPVPPLPKRRVPGVDPAKHSDHFPAKS